MPGVAEVDPTPSLASRAAPDTDRSRPTHALAHDQMVPMKFNVSELSTVVGVSRDTIRYYSRLGLLPESGRTPGGHRYFEESAVVRLRFIKGAQWFGLSLSEIGELLQVSDDGLCPCHFTTSLLEDRIALLHDQRDRLDDILMVLTDVLAAVGRDGFNERAMAVATDIQMMGHPGEGRGGQVAEERKRLLERRAALDRRLGELNGGP